MGARGLFWFRNDLRLQDHPLLSLALQTCDAISFVYILHPSQLAAHPQLQISRMGPFRQNFLRQTLLELESELQKRGHSLHFFVDNPTELLPTLCERYGVQHLFTSTHPAADEMTEWQTVVESLQGRTQCHQLSHFSLIEREPNPVPRVFTDFRQMVEPSLNNAVPETPEPQRWPRTYTLFEGQDYRNILGLDFTKIGLSEKSDDHVFEYVGGESQALMRLEDYIWHQDRLKEYKETRNQMVGRYFSSRLSPWLAFGSLSPRRVAKEIRLYEKSRVANESTYWLKFELLWRDFFYFQAQAQGSKIFQFTGSAPRPSDHRRGSFKDQFDRFGKWAGAETGQPFVDAILQELNTTGFTSNRGRQVAASFLIFDLGVDWRWGAQYFESKLIDFDPCSNYGNWAYIAGVGSDPRPIRRFDPLRQAELYDPEGHYQAIWNRDLSTTMKGERP